MFRMGSTLLGGAVAGVMVGTSAVVAPVHAAVTAAATAATGTTWRTTARNESFTDASGVVWQYRQGWQGNIGRSTGLAGHDVTGTTNDGLYQSLGHSITGYAQPVVAAGDYRVTLHLAEDYWTEPGKRVFDVTAEGRTVLSNVDIFKAVGKGAAYDVTFDVPVTDGELDLGFVVRADRAQVGAIEVTQLGQVSGSTVASENAATTVSPTSHIIEFSPKSFLYQDVRSAPVAADSADLTKVLAGQVAGRYSGVAAFNAYQYNTSVYRATSSTPRTDVKFWDCQNKGYTPNNLVSGTGQFLGVPIPSGAVPALGNDGTMTVYDPASDKVWEFWQMRRDPASGSWQACWGGRVDNASTSQGYFSGTYGATATGLVMGGGVITMDDIRRGVINHALQISVLDAAKGRFSWPAQRGDGTLTSGTVLTEGRRLRLDPTLDVTTLGLTPIGQMVARAAQRYGFVIADKGGAVAVKTQAGLEQKAATGVNPWDGLLGGVSPGKVMTGFPWDRMQFLPTDYGRP